MKLKKLIKYFDPMVNIVLQDWENEVLWSGECFNLQAAVVDTKEDRNRYLKELEENEDYKNIEQVLAAKKYRKWVLLDNGDYDVVFFNKKDGSIVIYIEEPKEEI